MSTASQLAYRVEAYNISHASENKIHDDTVARKLGFTGGLVPGVEMYAYLSNVAVQRWDRAWLERGRLECRFGKPLYDGHMAEVGGTTSEAGELELRLTSDGQECATGRASLPTGVPPPALDGYRQASPPETAARPPASEASLAKGTWLGIRPFVMTEAISDEYLRNIKEALGIYRAERLVHPGLVLRLCNSALRENVVLAPWIHVGSEVQNYSVIRIGEEVSLRAQVTDNYERKGHRLVDLDCVVAAGARVAALVKHTAIYALRHLKA